MWTIEQAAATYNLERWGSGYFSINDQGHLEAHPNGVADGPGIDLYQLASELPASGLSLPVLLRFTDILHHRVDTLCDAFGQAMQKQDYDARYTAVYPIKVNQQHSVVSEILARGGRRVGLEAGSKPELMAVLGLSSPGATVVCNGYKDREYIRLALIGRRMGLRVYIVVEKLSELELILQEAQALGVEPMLGVRVRLASIGAGKWQNTGGEKSKFGLQADQVLAMVERLRTEGMQDNLQLLHFHLGSQVANIRDIQRGLGEAARYYAGLRDMGLSVSCVDVGGGLGVDYEGAGTRSACSINYTVQEYANNVVRILHETCVEHDLPFPEIITESGRAMTAHHAVLVTNVIDREQAPGAAMPQAPSEDEPGVVQDLWKVLQSLDTRSALEAWHDAVHWLSEAQTMFNHGLIDIPQRARVESLYYAICHRARSVLLAGQRSHREVLDELDEKLADKVFCNFSVFQSMPDVWAIEQIFPIMPLHRLDEPPTRRAVLQDLTCDSDGRIQQYVDGEGVESTLPVHPHEPGQSYLLGIFLIGAYQEILGDMHNLFGDTDSVNVQLTADGGWSLKQAQQGDTVDSLLRYVRLDPEALKKKYRENLEKAGLNEGEFVTYLQELEAGLEGYTYLED